MLDFRRLDYAGLVRFKGNVLKLELKAITMELPSLGSSIEVVTLIPGCQPTARNVLLHALENWQSEAGAS